MSFKIELKTSGHCFETIGEESILEAGFRSGINLAYSCLSGSCGDCRAKVISGDVEKNGHYDFALTEAEKLQNTILLCRNKAKSDCIIDAVEARNATDIPEQSIQVKVAKIENITEDYINLQLRTPRTKVLRFLAGQQIQVSVKGIESYTSGIASCPCNGMILQMHLYKNDTHPFVQYVVQQMAVGESLTIQGPVGNLTLEEDSSRPIVMIAVDTAFASMKSIIEHAIALDLQQAIHLYWIVTKRHQHYHDNYCRSWELALETFVYQPLNVESEESDMGRVIDAIIARSPIETEIDLYLSGPKYFTNIAHDKFVQHGTPLQRIFEENSDNIIA